MLKDQDFKSRLNVRIGKDARARGRDAPVLDYSRMVEGTDAAGAITFQVSVARPDFACKSPQCQLVVGRATYLGRAHGFKKHAQHSAARCALHYMA